VERKKRVKGFEFLKNDEAAKHRPLGSPPDPPRRRCFAVAEKAGRDGNKKKKKENGLVGPIGREFSFAGANT